MPCFCQASCHSAPTARSHCTGQLTLNAVDGRQFSILVNGVDLLHGHAVVEALLFLIATVAEAVPLRRGLRVEGPDVIVGEEWGFDLEFEVKGAAGEERFGLGCERPVQGDAWGSLSVSRNQVRERLVWFTGLLS